MKYVLAAVMIAVLGVTLGALSSPYVAAWDPPEDCADEDRTIAGNRNSPCKVVVPDISHIEYRIRMAYPQCVEEMLMHMPGSTAPAEPPRAREISLHDVPSGSAGYHIWQQNLKTIKDGQVLVTGNTWNLKSTVGSTSYFGNPRAERTTLRVAFRGSSSNMVERPRTDAVAEPSW